MSAQLEIPQKGTYYQTEHSIESFHMTLQITCSGYVRVMFHLCLFLPTLHERLDWHFIQRSEPLGTYVLSVSIMAVSQSSGGKN